MLKRIRRLYRLKITKKSFAAHAVADASTVFMPGARCENDGNRENIRIGAHCTVGAALVSRFGGVITVGENTYIGPDTSLQAKESIRVGKNVIIANNVLILDNNNHPTSPEARLEMSACADFLHDPLWSWKDADSAPVVIEDNVWIGRDARVLKGVTVGKGSIVALGAVVTHDVPPYTVVAGNPARVVKTLTPPESGT